MPIKVACKCGASFAVKDELAGKTVACPKCKQPLKIPGTVSAGTPATKAPAGQPTARPAPAGLSGAPALANPAVAASVFDEVGLGVHHGVRCPKCNAALPPNAVLCVHCGFHLQQGAKIETDLLPTGDAHSRVAVNLLQRAEAAIETDKVEEKKNRSQGAPWWIVLLSFIGVLAFLAMMFMLPGDRAFEIAGWMLIVAGGLGSTYFQIRMIMVAFQENTTQGLLFLFVPLYPLYYIFSRWGDVGTFFLMSLACSTVSAFGWGALLLAPMLGEKEENVGQRLPVPIIRELVCDAGASWLERAASQNRDAAVI